MSEEKKLISKKELSKYLTKITDTIGFGLVEKVYQNALDYELKKDNYEVEQEVNINIIYENINIGTIRADTIVNKNIILELKAVDKLTIKHETQLKRYLKFTKIKKGYLININYCSFTIESFYN